MTQTDQIIVYYVTGDTDGQESVESESPETQESKRHEVFQCQFCPSTFDRELGLYGHLNSHKVCGVDSSHSFNSPKFSRVRLLPVLFLDAHLHSQAWKLSEDTWPSTGAKNFTEQNSNRHFRGVSHPFECPQCGLRFDRKSQLGYHIEKNHEQVSFARWLYQHPDFEGG